MIYAVIVLLAIILSVSSKVFELPAFKYVELFSGNSEVSSKLLTTLSEIGALQIVDIPDFAVARKDALDGLAACLVAEDNAPTMKMPDGSKRISSGSATVHGVAGSMTGKCGDKANSLRSLVDTTAHKLFQSLDKNTAVDQDPVLMKPSFHNFEELMSHGEHLEHLHTYYSPSTRDVDHTKNIHTMDFHLDSGLMIAMTTGYYAGATASEISGLHMELPGKNAMERVQVSMDENALIFLMGDGAAQWLAPIYGKSFRAVPHAMIADLPAASQGTRSWYGKMFLPPAEAIIPSEGISFANYHLLESMAAMNATTAAASKKEFDYAAMLPAACGGTKTVAGGVRSGYSSIVKNTLCTTADGSPGVMCWMQCSSVVGLSCGTSAECADTQTGQIYDGSSMCHSANGAVCQLECPAK